MAEVAAEQLAHAAVVARNALEQLENQPLPNEACASDDQNGWTYPFNNNLWIVLLLLFSPNITPSNANFYFILFLFETFQFLHTFYLYYNERKLMYNLLLKRLVLAYLFL